MEISLRQSNQLKSIAILMMLCLHLFNRNYHGLFEPLIFIGKQPLTFYISLFCDACVPIFSFVSGYGLYYKYLQNKNAFTKENFFRLKKLYLNYWIIILIFPVSLGLILKYDNYPGSIMTFFSNFSGVNPTYNGAWWFFTIYVLFVITSRFWFSILERVDPVIYLLILMLAYFVGFYFRIYKTNIFSDPFFIWLHQYASLYLCTLFQFMLGAFAIRYKWNSFIAKYLENMKYKNLIIFVLVMSLIIFHSYFPNLIVAPFTGLAIIFLYCQLNISERIQKVIDFFSVHSTNIWLIHMFFYMIFTPQFIYSFRYPLIIFMTLVFICVLCSYVINFITAKAQKIIA